MSYRLSMQSSGVEARVLDAAKRCVERWGFEKVTIDDIVSECEVSRATLYRLFPGGRDVLFDALRSRERSDFFDALTAQVGDADDLEDLIVRLVVTATHELRDDAHLAAMLASEPGSVLGELTLDGLPRIIGVASDYLTPVLKPFLDPQYAEPLIDLLVRITISYFLAPSEHVDLGDADSARVFLQPGIAALTAGVPDSDSTTVLSPEEPT